MRVTAMRCDACQVDIQAAFPMFGVGNLPAEHQRFIEMFVLAGGNLKTMAEQTGVSYPTVRNGMGQIAFAAKDDEKAKQWFLKAPHAPSAQHSLVNVYLLQGEYKQAADQSAKLLAELPEDSVDPSMPAQRARLQQCHDAAVCATVQTRKVIALTIPLHTAAKLEWVASCPPDTRRPRRGHFSESRLLRSTPLTNARERFAIFLPASFPSSPRRRGSICLISQSAWIPACAEMTVNKDATRTHHA